MDRIVNLLIFAITAALMPRLFRREGRFSADAGRRAFRFFTVQSNAFCALSALLMALAPGARWAWLLKYVGTAAVSVTMLTVLLFLGPSAGYRAMLKGPDFFMHLVTPLMVIASFCLWEQRGLTWGEALAGMLPVVLYGLWYLYKTVYAPAEKRWKDFYGFNRNGKWPVAFAAMMLGGLMVCALLFLAQR